jgi:hypothetical protein
MARSFLPTLGLVATVALLLGGCRTYPEPTFLPPQAPQPPAGVIDLYRALKPAPLPPSWPSGTFAGVTQPAAGFLPGKGVLLIRLPVPGGPPDGLYLGDVATDETSLLARVSPGKAQDIATAAGAGQAGVAFQVGPESGPRSAPVELLPWRGPRRSIETPGAGHDTIATSFLFVGHELLYLSTRTVGENDLTAVIACDLATGACRRLFHEASLSSSLDVIAFGADRLHVYLALKPADPGDPVQGEIVTIPLRGGRTHVLWRTAGVMTSMVRAHGLLIFTEDFGVDEGLYLRERETMIRLTAPGVFPSNPSCGDGYVAWWADRPELLDLRSDRLYRIPGSMPEIYGDLLTYVTPAGLHWVLLPPA